MQNLEFNKLMSGHPAKWADLEKAEGQNLAALLKSLPNDSSEEVKNAARSEIEKREVEIPAHIRSEIDKFIAEHKAIGTRSRTIRRMVKKLWNITVI